MSEPCRHERFDADIREHGALGAAHLEIQRLTAELAALKADYARDGIQDVVKLVQEYEPMKRELKAAKAVLTNLRMEIRLLTIGPAHQHHAGKITPSQLCDLLERTEPTDLPKGKKP